MCGTKSDLLEEDKRRREIDFHDVQDYADGVCLSSSALYQGPFCRCKSFVRGSNVPLAMSLGRQTGFIHWLKFLVKVTPAYNFSVLRTNSSTVFFSKTAV